MRVFHLRDLVFLVTLSAIGIAAISSQSYGLVAVLALFVVGYIGIATVEAIQGAGEHKQRALGIAIFGWAYLLLRRENIRPGWLIEDLLELAQITQPETRIAVYVGDIFLAFPFAILGGMLSVWNARPAKTHEATPPEAPDC